jgi:pyruvate/2-oxoglutarate/acetoin dehydrogenase E1 component
VTSERQIQYKDALIESLSQEMQRDPTVFVMGEDIAGGAGRAHLGITEAWGGPFGLTKGLIQQFGSARVRDTPISEGGFLGTAIGAALTGFRPVIDLMYMDFVGVCFDQLISNAAKIRYMMGGQAKVPLTIFTRFGAGTGNAAQHSSIYYSILTHIPGLKVVVPSDPFTLKGLLISAIRDDDPVIVCNDKKLIKASGAVPAHPYTLPIGESRILLEGKDLTLVGIGYTTQLCLEAAQTLRGLDIESEVVDLLSLSPLDKATILQSVRKTNRLIIVDEDTPRCGIASDIAAIVVDEAFDFLDAPIKRVTAPHTPVPYSKPLEDQYLPSSEKIVRIAKELLTKL